MWLESALLDEDERTQLKRARRTKNGAARLRAERTCARAAALAADAETRGTGAVPVSPSPRLARRLAALVPPACVVCEPTRGWRRLRRASRALAGTDEGREARWA